MKHMISLIFSFICLIGVFCKAQEQGFYIGAEGGAGASLLRGSAVGSQSPLLGYSGGLFFQYGFKKTFSIRTGGYFDLKGNAYKFDMPQPSGTTTKARIRNEFNYVSVPLLFRFSFGKKLKVFVDAGPYGAYLLKQTIVFPDVKGVPVPGGKFDNTSSYKRTEFGVAEGVGISYAFDRMLLTIEMRNNLGLTDINNGAAAKNTTIQTNATNILFGVAYCLFRKKVPEAPAAGSGK